MTIYSYHYIAENYEDDFKSAIRDSSLRFSRQMLDVESIIMMSDVGFYFSQLHVLLVFLRHKMLKYSNLKQNEIYLWRNDCTTIW